MQCTCGTCFIPVTFVSNPWHLFHTCGILISYLWHLVHTCGTCFIAVELVSYLCNFFHTCGNCFIPVRFVSYLRYLFHTKGTFFIHAVFVSYLQYFGHQSISVLDGGFSQWLEENGDVSKERCSNCKVCNLCLFLNSIIK